MNESSEFTFVSLKTYSASKKPSCPDFYRDCVKTFSQLVLVFEMNDSNEFIFVSLKTLSTSKKT